MDIHVIVSCMLMICDYCQKVGKVCVTQWTNSDVTRQSGGKVSVARKPR